MVYILIVIYDLCYFHKFHVLLCKFYGCMFNSLFLRLMCTFLSMVSVSHSTFMVYMSQCASMTYVLSTNPTISVLFTNWEFNYSFTKFLVSLNVLTLTNFKFQMLLVQFSWYIPLMIYKLVLLNWFSLHNYVLRIFLFFNRFTL